MKKSVKLTCTGLSRFLLIRQRRRAGGVSLTGFRLI
jgi:hypothetical protein